ncbi:radical SAM family heme chaperone HemW [Echinimonas agarilytica]|uniref:Heme chaperone HemW n=1 Tax=Echinimonas agarilytica TaxID=1215918 RepID=A0AA41W599_9GAMM|nr:radical SAM family heme chaperone HemW [Echinimonas agarilytica]MCM2678905.1 radical SAM family heme chaperone HemW [Echinimonas agarilytica]
MVHLELPPLSLYVHIPWCVEKCPYCDFNSHALKGEIPELQYVEALLADLRQDLLWVQGREIQTVFIGGGTPSLLSVKAMTRLINGLKDTVAFAYNAEITMEANPGTVEAEKFAGFVAAGITRISIGVQSLHSRQLNLLGRIHDKDQAITAIELASQLPLQSFNIDLMHGLPEQQLKHGLDDLAQAIQLAPPHLSWYQLTLEPNTHFYRKPPKLPDEEVLVDIFEQGHQRLTQAGYERYEISGYSKPGHQCSHNLNYWTFGDYLGIGCGAHGKITVVDSQRLLRTSKVASPASYLTPSKNPRISLTDVADDDRAFEYFMNRARLTSAAPLEEFERRTGQCRTQILPYLEQQAGMGLMILEEANWQMTNKGLTYFNNVLEPLIRT